jgi:dipeptidyl aminopeptidase/acylaminoacyl peptidase
LTDHLQRNGIAVLLPDKRGSESSDGDWRTSTLEDLAGDTVAAVEHVAKSDLPISRVGLVGLSQGGWIAPIAATESDDVAFVVSFSGAAVTTDEQLYHEETHNIMGMGTYRFVAQPIARLSTARIQGTDFWSHLAGFDPMPYWREVAVPVFFAYGAGDPNVPVDASVSRLAELGDSVTVKVYPDGGHGITDPETGFVQDAVLDDIVAFIDGI